MHALLEPGIAGARGIEIDRIKCDKAAAFLKQVGAARVAGALVVHAAGSLSGASSRPAATTAAQRASPCPLLTNSLGALVPLQAVAELQRRGVADGALVPPPVECSAIENVSCGLHATGQCSRFGGAVSLHACMLSG